MTSTPNIPKSSEIGTWFNTLIEDIELLQLKLETGIASKEVKRIVDTLRGGDPTEIYRLNAEVAQKFFIAEIIQDYLKIIRQTTLKKLAFAPNNSQLLVWVEIEDDDEQTERDIIIAEAKINAKYHPHGWTVDTTIVETTDQISVPANYKTIKRPNLV